MFPLKVLYDVCDVNRSAINACRFQRFVEQHAGRTHKRVPLEIFFVARLFSDEHDSSMLCAFAENRLCTSFPEVAGAAAPRCLTQRLQGRM
jgi:hypothetical protein